MIDRKSICAGIAALALGLFTFGSAQAAGLPVLSTDAFVGSAAAAEGVTPVHYRRYRHTHRRGYGYRRGYRRRCSAVARRRGGSGRRVRNTFRSATGRAACRRALRRCRSALYRRQAAGYNPYAACVVHRRNY